MTSDLDNEPARVASLLDAQAKAADLFQAVGQRDLVRAGVTELQASDAIRDLANEMFGTTKHWHKRVVRAGVNTLEPYHQNPPNRLIETDDIAFCDFGPIFDGFEADFGRTFVVGDDPVKHRLNADLAVLFDAGREFFATSPAITGEQLWDFIVAEAAAKGWAWGGTIAGHVVGQFPHDQMPGADDYSRVTPGNDRPMRAPDSAGRVSHWILEIHIVALDRQFGGFYEELLDLGGR